MRKIVLLFLFFQIALNLNAQGFIVKNNSLLWQQTYDISLTADDIYKSMIISYRFNNVTIVDSMTVVATVKSHTLDYTSLGYKKMSLPIFLTNNNFGPMLFVVQIRPGKIRITAKNMHLTPHDVTGTILYDSRLDFYAVENGEFSTTFLSDCARIYGKHLEYIAEDILHNPLNDF